MFNEVPEDLGTRPQLHQSRRSQSPPSLPNLTAVTAGVNSSATSSNFYISRLNSLPCLSFAGFALTQFLPSCFAMYSALSAAGKSWSRTFTVSG